MLHQAGQDWQRDARRFVVDDAQEDYFWEVPVDFRGFGRFYGVLMLSILTKVKTIESREKYMQKCVYFHGRSEASGRCKRCIVKIVCIGTRVRARSGNN